MESTLLLELNARGLGIIENTTWQLAPGLNVITGETGAGKSLVIDAIEALMGSQVDDEAIRYGSDETMIEGVFALPQGSLGTTIAGILEEKGISLEDDTLIITFAARKQGRAVFRVNSHAVPKSVVHQLGRLLIDIHGQSEHLGLLNRKYHLDFLDAFGDNDELLRLFTAKLTELRDVEQEIDTLNKQISDREHREDFLRFQITEIREANLKPDEEEALIQEQQVLSSTEKLKSLSHEIYQSLSGDEMSFGSTLDKLHHASRSLRDLIELDPRLAEQANLLEEVAYSIEEITRDVHSYGDALEYDPARLDEIESRLDIIRNLKRKYGGSIADILAFLKNAESELEGLSSSDERQAELERHCMAIKKEMGQIAAQLSKSRQNAAQGLVSAVETELGDLNMSEVRFEVSIMDLQGRDTIPLPSGENRSFNENGIDLVEFMVSTNPGEPLKPLVKIASTGETSRFMLALKSVLAQSDDTPVVVFDEIDIGVGGRSGEVIGRKLWALARNRQVVCVTHLPQIAVFADAHFGVRKEFVDERTSSILRKLEGKARLAELASMFAGPKFSETAMKNARESMGQAETWKLNSR
jgi:DNA repair protein RecN (Recombination protein N)